MSKKRVVKEIDFTGEDAHVALVEKGANGQSVLLMKNKSKEVDIEKAQDVQVTMSMVSFLQTFFYMYFDEANELAELLGYEPIDWAYDVMGKDTSVELLKSLDVNSTVSKELYDNIEKMSAEFTKLIKKRTEIMADKKKELEKGKDDLAVELEKQKTELAELKKSLEAEKAKSIELEKAAIKKEKAEMIELCKGYSFAEDSEKLAESLFLCKGIDGFDLILETLEKARTALKEVLEKEIGTDEEADLSKKSDNADHIDKTTELIKKRYAKENK